MAPTLKMIAERTGLSMSTVSQILNRRPNDFSSEDTKQAVFAAAEELGYKQNYAHKLLRGDHTGTVAILIAMNRILLEEHIQRLVLLLMNKFDRKGWISYLKNCAASAEENQAVIRELLARGVERFIFIGTPNGYAEIEEEIQRKNRFVCGYSPYFQYGALNDQLQSIQETIRYFRQKKHSRLKILFRTNRPERRQAMLDMFPGMSPEEVEEKYTYPLNFNGEVDNIDVLTDLGYQATRSVLEEDPSTDALYYLSDYFMLGGIRYLVEKRFPIGKQILLCGSNNIHAVRNNVFPLATWEFDLERLSDCLVTDPADFIPGVEVVKSRFITHNQGETT